MKQKISRENGFTLIELVLVIAILGILAAVAVPAYSNIVNDAHQANMDAVEGSMRSAVTMWASDELMNNGVYAYPPTATVTIPNMIENGEINDWVSGAGTWTYTPTGGTLVYTQTGGGVGYSISKTYNSGGDGDDDSTKNKKKKKKKYYDKYDD